MNFAELNFLQILLSLKNPKPRASDFFVDKTIKYPSPFVVRVLLLVGLSISKVFWSIRFVGVDNIPRNNSGLLIASNHQTYIDPVWISIPLRQKKRFMAFDRAFEWKFVGGLIRYLGAFPVKHPVDTGSQYVKESLRSLKDGACLIVFPEGARAFADGKIGEFRPGAVRIARKANVPILPVSISGGNTIWPQGRKYPKLFGSVTITYHKPILPSDYETDEAMELDLRSIIVS